jgi:hypothetical protein
MEVIIANGISMEFFELDEKKPEHEEMVTLVLKKKQAHYAKTNKAGNQILQATTRIFKSVPPKFTIRTHYHTIDIVASDVLYWGRIKQD